MSTSTALPPLSFPEAITSAVRKIATFRGRSRRSEFWWIVPPIEIIIILLPVAGLALGIATIPLTVRRLHDTGRSGWWWGTGVILQAVFMLLMYNISELLPIFFFMGDVIRECTLLQIVWFFMRYMLKYVVAITVLLAYNILLLIFLCQDSMPQANRYGESPKYITPEQAKSKNETL